MLIPNLNYKVIRPIPTTIMQPVIETCSKIDWDQDCFERVEAPLKGGKLIEYPFVIVGARKNTKKRLGDEELDFLRSTEPLMQWINIYYPDYLWIRGAVNSLPPGFSLKWHIDNNWHHPICTRLHVPVITNDGCCEMWEDERVHMAQGYLYEFDNRKLHSATNMGDQYRVHLVLDIIHESEWHLIEERHPGKEVRRRASGLCLDVPGFAVETV